MHRILSVLRGQELDFSNSDYRLDKLIAQLFITLRSPYSTQNCVAVAMLT